MVGYSFHIFHNSISIKWVLFDSHFWYSPLRKLRLLEFHSMSNGISILGNHKWVLGFDNALFWTLEFYGNKEHFGKNEIKQTFILFYFLQIINKMCLKCEKVNSTQHFFMHFPSLTPIYIFLHLFLNLDGLDLHWSSWILFKTTSNMAA